MLGWSTAARLFPGDDTKEVEVTDVAIWSDNTPLVHASLGQYLYQIQSGTLHR